MRLLLLLNLLWPSQDAVPGGYVTDWLGNTFEGAGPNGQGRWVQNMVDEAEVSPDGTVFTASVWDEAGRCTGLYKDGSTNEKLIAQYNGKGGHKAWGWGTGGNAVAVWGERFYLVNTEGDLMRFRWKPGDIQSAEYLDEVKCGKAAALAAREETLVVIGEDGQIQLRGAADLKERGRFPLPDAKEVAIAPDGSLWFIVGARIVHRGTDGKELPGEIADAVKPANLAFSPQGQLVVCEDGPRQQVLFYDMGAAPRPAGRFGQEGGLRAGTPGRFAPDKLYGLRGANRDKSGNLYVALCLGPYQGGGTAIRAFDPQGKVLWDLQSHAFVDAYSFDPASDGQEIYGADEILKWDPKQPPGKGWSLKSITLDPVKYPDDPRLKREGVATGILRRLEGRRVLYVTGQMSGGMKMFVFESEASDICRYAGQIGFAKDNAGWAWEVDLKGDVWHGDAPGKTIRRYRFQGFAGDGTPKYDREKPETFPWPPAYNEVSRVHYVPATDTLYVSGFTPEKKPTAWGEIGSVVTRFDGWVSGKRERKWEFDTPKDDEKLHPKSIDVAGDYLFVVQVKSTKGRPAQVSVYRASDGGFVGRMWPGKEVGGTSGWVDTSHALRAAKRADGEYLVLVEEDFRGKNLLYRWRPPK